MRPVRLLAALGLCAAFYAITARDVHAQEPFYSGKMITLVVGSPTGGGYDFHARTIAAHMGRHIPGAPTFVVKNMPAGGSVVAANYVASVAPQDGSHIALVQRTIPFDPIFKDGGVRFDAQRMQWIGSTTSEHGVSAVWHSSPHQKIEDVFQSEFIVGGNGPATDTELFPRALNRLLGTKFKVVGGYQGANEIVLAMERGELQGIANWSWTNVLTRNPEWLKEKKIRILLQMSVTRHPDLLDVPTAVDLARTDEQRKMLEVLMQVQALGRPFFMGPDVPSDRVQAIRQAFNATVKDAQFVSDVVKARSTVDPVSGEAMQAILAATYSLPQPLVDSIRAAIAP